MKKVAEHLHNYAIDSKDELEIDVFGRSAFNRYYYACFLATRAMLGDFKPSWKGTMHKSIPELLMTGVTNEPIKAFKLAQRNGLITISQCSKNISELRESTNDLAQVLLAAYDVRVLADYEPEETVYKREKIISIRQHKLSAASCWLDRVNGDIKRIRKLWSEAGLV